MSECWLGPIKGGVENEYGKVNILLQSYISKSPVDSFSLVSDMSYIAQVSQLYYFVDVSLYLIPCCSATLSQGTKYENMKNELIVPGRRHMAQYKLL